MMSREAVAVVRQCDGGGHFLQRALDDDCMEGRGDGRQDAQEDTQVGYRKPFRTHAQHESDADDTDRDEDSEG